MNISRDILYARHRLSYQQIDDLLGEKCGQECFRDKVKILHYVRNFVWITDLFKENGIEFISIKGPLLSYRIYNDPAVRLSHDVDFIVNLNDLSNVLTILKKHNFHFNEHSFWPEDATRQRLILKYSHHLCLINDEKNFCVEIHWVLLDERFIKKEKMHAIIHENLDVLTFSDRTFTVLNKEFELLYLIIHGSIHGWRRLKWLLDITKYPIEDIDCSKFNELVDQLHASHLLGQVNELLKMYFNTQLPFKQSSPSAYLTYYANMALKDKEVEPSSVRDLFLNFKYAYSLFPSFSYKCRLLFFHMINVSDIGHFKSSYLLAYYIYRPISLFKRRILHV